MFLLAKKMNTFTRTSVFVLKVSIELVDIVSNAHIIVFILKKIKLACVDININTKTGIAFKYVGLENFMIMKYKDADLIVINLLKNGNIINAFVQKDSHEIPLIKFVILIVGHSNKEFKENASVLKATIREYMAHVNLFHVLLDINGNQLEDSADLFVEIIKFIQKDTVVVFMAIKGKIHQVSVFLIVHLEKLEKKESVLVHQVILKSMGDVLIVLNIHNMLMEFVFVIMANYLTMESANSFHVQIKIKSGIQLEIFVNAKDLLYGCLEGANI